MLSTLIIWSLPSFVTKSQYEKRINRKKIDFFFWEKKKEYFIFSLSLKRYFISFFSRFCAEHMWIVIQNSKLGTVWKIKEKQHLEFLKLEIHIRNRVRKTRFASVKVPHRSRVFKSRVLCKNNFTYSSVFKSYSDVLKPYNGIFPQKFFL